MDRSQANEYLDALWDAHEGVACLAFKGMGDEWGEAVFDWPHQRDELLAWAESHGNGHVFICPALRSGERKKGNGVHHGWLWADVDWEKVPESKRDQVERRMRSVGTMLVASGTGDNRHVYIRLTGDVDSDTFARLNTGLRDFLYADNKQADNSLLRLPGTTNRKTGSGAPVYLDGGHGKRISAEKLQGLKAFADARAAGASGGAGEWTPVDVSGVRKGGVAHLCAMSAEEAENRFSSKYKATFYVVGKLLKKGFSSDQIHSLMDDFPPAKAKASDEHGSHDVHKDVARVLAIKMGSGAQVATDPATDPATESDQGIFQEVDDGTPTAAVQDILRRRENNRLADQIEAELFFREPPPAVTVSDLDVNPPLANPHLVKHLAAAMHNVLITAQYKTGKTTLVVSNLLRSLVDGVPFLDEFEVIQFEGNVGFWSCEMNMTDLHDNYTRPSGYVNKDRLIIQDLQGHTVSLLSSRGRAWAVQWLKTHNVKVWAIDSLARLCRMAGVGENENDQVLRLLHAVEEVKKDAGVQSVFIIAHTGRVAQEEGQERARGATAINDWADVQWVLTNDDGIRFFAVSDGRGGIKAIKATSLIFDEITKHLVYGASDRIAVRAEKGVQAVLGLVKEHSGINQANLIKKLMEPHKVGRNTAKEWISEAVECNFVQVKKMQGKREFLYYPYEAPRGGASMRSFDFAKADRKRT